MNKHIHKLTAIIFLCGVFLTGYTQSDTVRMQNNVFVPDILEIETGTQVVWINDDAVLHTATSGVDCTPDGAFASGDMELNDVFTFTFDASGSFPYYCVYHCNIGMTGTIVVSSVGIGEKAASGLTVKSFGPVPSDGKVYLELNISENTSVEISLYELKGTKVMTVADGRQYQPGEYRFTIPGDELDPGTYLCRIVSDDDVITRKIILY